MKFVPAALFLFLVGGVAAGCGASRVGNERDLSAGGGDADFNFGDGGSGMCDAAHPCGNGKRCYMGACIPDNGTCNTDEECQNDSYCDCTMGGGGDAGACMGGVCVPWGTGPRGAFDPGCAGQSFSASALVAPKTQCNFTDGNMLPVIMMPVVIDLDGDGKPEILFNKFDFNSNTIMYAIDPDACALKWKKSVPLLFGTQLTAGDLDGDKIPEIIGVTGAVGGPRKIVVYDNKGNLLATADQPFQTDVPMYDYSGAAIANLDGKGNAEIVVAAQALKYTKGNNVLQTMWIHPAKVGKWGSLTAVADVDLDGVPDVIVGNAIYDGVTGADKTPPGVAQFGGGYPAIGDFDKATPEPEIVLFTSPDGSPGVIRIYNPKTGKVIFGPHDFGTHWGGPPTVADFDGDGEPEVGVAGELGYAVWKLECEKMNKPAKCTGPVSGELWEKKTHDFSSGSTGSSVFDFNGDGAAEVVYRDEQWLRVYDGSTGKTLFAQTVSSGTLLELPVVADINNDGHADIVVASDLGGGADSQPEIDTGTKPGMPTQGILVLRDPMNRWMPSRNIWNEHTYHITNVADDGTIPLVEADNWKTWNNYRQNVQGQAGMAAPAPDLTGGQSTGIDGGQADCTKQWTLRANLCNRGAAPVAAGIPGSFYNFDPRQMAGAPICTAKTTMPLQPGQCETIACDWKMPPQTPTDLWFRADDDGTGKMPQSECKKMNDMLSLPQAACMKIG